MTRSLLLVSLCLVFPSAQQHVIGARQSVCARQATGATDRAPIQDWQRLGGGTTRAIERRLGAHAFAPLAIAASTLLPFDVPALRPRVAHSANAASLCGIPLTRLRI